MGSAVVGRSVGDAVLHKNPIDFSIRDPRCDDVVDGIAQVSRILLHGNADHPARSGKARHGDRSKPVPIDGTTESGLDLASRRHDPGDLLFEERPCGGFDRGS
jgi:hypothetical protein